MRPNVKRSRTYRPRKRRIVAIHGVAASVDRPDRNVAPAKAPTAPGTPRRSTIRQSTLPKRQWEAPDTSVVPSSERCTDAEAAAGDSPTTNISDDEVTPYAIPRAPSTNWAANPTMAMTSSLRTDGLLADGHSPKT